MSTGDTSDWPRNVTHVYPSKYGADVDYGTPKGAPTPPPSKAERLALDCFQCGAPIADPAALSNCWHCGSDNFQGRAL